MIEDTFIIFSKWVIGCIAGFTLFLTIFVYGSTILKTITKFIRRIK